MKALLSILFALLALLVGTGLQFMFTFCTVDFYKFGVIAWAFQIVYWAALIVVGIIAGILAVED